MKRLLNDALLPFLNKIRPGNVQPAALVQVMAEKVEGKDMFDVVDTRHMGLPMVRNFGEGHASYLNDKQIYILEIFVSHHPSAEKAIEWLKEWEPRLQNIRVEVR